MRNPGQDHNEVIEILAELYPKTFFATPKQRRPLKHDIIDDLEAANDPRLAGFDVGAALEWYVGHISYDYACTQGTGRLNLDGKVVGKITASEAREAAERVAIKGKAINERRSARNADPWRTVQGLHGSGGMTDDQLRKIPAPSPAKSGNNIERKLDDAIAALTKARELLTVDNIALRMALLKGAISVADTSIRELLKETEIEG